MNQAYWKMLQEIADTHEIVIDRPKGSRHPRFHHIVYPLDHGYLQGTSSMDGSGIDVWRGSKEDGVVNAMICTVDRLKGDSEIKLLIGCTEEEIQQANAFHNESEYMKGLLIRRE